MSEDIDVAEIGMWVERLSHPNEEARIEAASELSRLGIYWRGSTQTRGAVRRAAASRFPASLSDGLKPILTALQDESPAVRREATVALGEWGDDSVTDALSAMLIGSERDPDESVRRACVRALWLIGGRTAVAALREAAEHDSSEAVRRDAISALTELGVQEQRSGTATGVRIRGGIRRQARRPGVCLMPESDLQTVLETLARIEQNIEEKNYLRHKAATGLKMLVQTG